MSRSTHNRLFRGRVYPGNSLHKHTHTKPNQQALRTAHMSAHVTGYTLQHRTVLIVSPLILQTIIIAWICYGQTAGIVNNKELLSRSNI